MFLNFLFQLWVRTASDDSELNESFKLIHEPIHWSASWFDQAFNRIDLKEWILCEWASLIAQRKLDGAFE